LTGGGEEGGRAISRVLFAHRSEQMVISLERLSPAASCGLPAARATRVRSRCLFGLAPTGGCRATPVARRAVGSYPTVSPLPRNRGGLFSVALSVALRRPGAMSSAKRRGPPFRSPLRVTFRADPVPSVRSPLRVSIPPVPVPLERSPLRVFVPPARWPSDRASLAGDSPFSASSGLPVSLAGDPLSGASAVQQASWTSYSPLFGILCVRCVYTPAYRQTP